MIKETPIRRAASKRGYAAGARRGKRRLEQSLARRFKQGAFSPGQGELFAQQGNFIAAKAPRRLMTQFSSGLQPFAPVC
jgi:hypothetical protein